MSVLHRQQPVGSALTPVGENLRFVPRRSSRASRFADFSFQGLVWLSAAGVLAIVAFILTELIKGSSLSLHQFGWKFFIGSDWDPVNGNFGSVPFIYGTLVSSLVALIIAVPLSLGVAIFITEMCPRSLRGILSYLTELLAAIPSVIYGMWAIFVLIPLLRRYIGPALAKTLGWTGLFTGPIYGGGMLTAGIILAIMIVPIIGSYAVGDDSSRRAAQCPRRHLWRDHPRIRTSSGRDYGCHYGDRKSSGDYEVVVCSGLHHGKRDCE